MRHDRIRTALILLSLIAAALGVLTAVVVFYPVGSYQAIAPQMPSTTTSTDFGTGSSVGSATASSTQNAFAISTSGTGTLSGGGGTGASGQFGSEFSPPYPVTWTEGKEQFAVIGASFRDGELALSLSIQMGNDSECVPVNVRLVVDEAGTLRAPESPAGAMFAFPDTQTCNGTPGALYSESLVWKIGSMPSPYLLTTGGTSNIFFSVATSSAGGVDVALPSRSG